MQEEQEKVAKKEEEVAERQRQDVATITELRENIQQQEARWQDLDLECGKLRIENRQRSTQTSRRVTIQSPMSRDLQSAHFSSHNM